MQNKTFEAYIFYMSLCVSIVIFETPFVCMKKPNLKASIALFAFFLLQNFNLFAQKDSLVNVTTVYFPAVTDSLDISKTGYQLVLVKDIRTNKSNNGYLIQKNVKQPLAFKDSLPPYISSFVFHKKPDNHSKPVTLSIEKFRCFSSTDGKIDEAQLYMKAKFIDENNQTVHSYERTLNYKKKSQPNFVAKIVFYMVRAAFSGLQNSTTTSYSNAALSSGKQASNTQIINKNNLIHKISYPKEKAIWEHPNYYVDKVEDIRCSKRNEGSALVGYFNRKAEVKTDSSLSYFIQNSCTYRTKEGKKPVKMYLKKFECNEDLTSDGERGRLVFSAQLVLDSMQNTYNLYQNSIVIDTTDIQDITPLWPNIVSKALQRYFQDFNLKNISHFESDPKNIDSSEIEVMRYHFRENYFYQNKELTKLRDFERVFSKSPNSEAKLAFKNAQNWIRTGRRGVIIGSALTVYALADYLSMNDKSIKNWYKADPEKSKSWMIEDKKAFLWTGSGFMVLGLVYNLVGKAALSKAIRLHNKTVYEKVTINLEPDLQNRGCIFHMNLQLGQNPHKIKP